MIAHSLARILFANENAIGKTFLLDNKTSMKVGAVYEDLPENTNFQGTVLLLPWTDPGNNYRQNNTNWQDHNSELYVELNENITAAEATEKIKNLPSPFIKDWKETALVYPLDKTASLWRICKWKTRWRTNSICHPVRDHRRLRFISRLHQFHESLYCAQQQKSQRSGYPENNWLTPVAPGRAIPDRISIVNPACFCDCIVAGSIDNSLF